MEAINSGAYNYYEKPYDIEKLIISVDHAADKCLKAQKLLENERRLNLALEGAHLGLWDHDFTSGKVYRTSEWFTMLGYKPGEIEDTVGAWKELIYPDDLEQVENSLDEYNRGITDEIRIEHRLRCSDNNYKWILAKGRISERDSNDNPLRATGVHIDINERKNSEENSNTIRSLLGSVLRNSNAIIWSVDKNYNLIFGNEIFSRYLDLVFKMHLRSGDSLILDIMDESEKLEWIGYYNRALCGEKFSVEKKNEFSDPPKWDEFHFGPIKDESGNCTGVTIMALDISDRKRSEEAIKESEAKFNAITEAAQDAIILIDDMGDTLYFNKAAESLFGYIEEEMIGKNLHEFIMPEKYAEQYSGAIAKFKDTGQGNAIGKIIELSARNKNGDEFPVELSISSVKVDGRWCGVGVVRDIRARKKAEIELHESEKKYRGLFENAGVGIYHFSSDGRILSANPAMISLLGYDSHEEITDIVKIEDFYTDQDSVAELMRIVNMEGMVFGFESCWKVKSERILYIKESVRVVRDTDNNILYYEGIAEDITKEKNMRTHLEYEKKLLQYLMNNIPDTIYFKDKDYKFTRINKAQAELLGIENPDDAIGKSDTDFFESAVARKSFKDDKIVIDQGIPVINEQEELINKSGESKWVSATKMPIKDVQGNIIGLVGISRDITTIKQAEITLAESEKKFRNIFENAAVAIYRIDLDGNVIMANAEFINMLGYHGFRDIADKNMIEKGVVKPEMRYELLQRVLDEEEVIGFEDIWIIADGTELFVSENMKLMKDENSGLKFFEGAVLDITPSKIAERKMIEAKELAEKSDRLKTEFLAQMSHEIRTPINAILNFAYLIREDIADHIDEDTLAAFDMIETSGNNITRTMELILQMSEIQSGSCTLKMDKFDLYLDILLKLYNDFKKQIDKSKVKLRLVADVKKAPIKGDKFFIESIFNHLLDNACKYTDEGEILIKLEVTNGLLVVKIKDTGIGMNQEYHKDIFTPFLQEDHGYSRKYDGSGLGLAIVKNYCDFHNAEISFTSEKNIGTEFTVIFTHSAATEPLKGMTNPDFGPGKNN